MFDEPHAQSLEFLAARALAEGKTDLAFRLSDRRCRIAPAVEPHCYVLRAEAARRMGDDEGAVHDIERAIKLAPDDVGANRKLVAWGDRAQRVRAARALLRGDRNWDILKAAAGILFAEGEPAVASLCLLEDSIEGWAAWQGGGRLEISVADGQCTMTASFEADASHPLASICAATDLSLPRPKSSAPQSIVASGPRGAFHVLRAAPNAPSPAKRRLDMMAPARMAGVTIIVPVYADFEATQTCLEGIASELKSHPGHRAVLIDDSSIDPRIARALAELAREDRFDVLTNARNLGFIGSINRALEHIADGDVILLNADTIVPLGFVRPIGRCRALVLRHWHGHSSLQ